METIRCLTKFIVVLWIVVVKHGAHASSSCANCTSTNVTCVDEECLSRCVKNTSSGECQECRDSKFYGKQCELSCPSTCLNSRCQIGNRGPECTDGCVDGKKGVICGADCSTSCLRCERYGDKCVGYCRQKGYYGVYCDRICPVNCDGNCTKDTGQCDKCKPGHAGKYCTVRCSTNCDYDCDVSNCSGGCVDGYKGEYCEETCSPNCGEAGCDKDSGQCTSCKPGYRGIYCKQNCTDTCDDSGCDRDSGQCTSCKSGYRGIYCNQTCTDTCGDSGCDRDSGQCNDSGDHITPRSFLRDPVFMSGIGLMALAVVVFLVFVARVLWKRKCRRKKVKNKSKEEIVEKNNSKKGDDDVPMTTKCSTTTNPTYMLSGGDLQQVRYCEHLQGEGVTEKIFDEFLNLPPPDSRQTFCGSLESNAIKNRYKDVLPFDETRVPLEIWEAGTTDYINASFISGYRNQIQYVAAQGPNIHMVDDFWRMIWQQNTTKIVMLTNLVEAGKIKCEMYWPFCSSDFQRYGQVCVQCVEEKVYQHHTLRTLAVWKDSAKTRTVYQFHFTSWPDHGVPDERSIIDFHRVVKNTGYNALGPLVIHCSAGVGRSGTFIALDFLLDQSRYEGRVCIFNCIQQFRFQRMKMVQTKEQYKFLYDILVNALRYRGTLPRYYAPVLIECPSCWNRLNDEASAEENVSMEENNIEYQPLWNFGNANREMFLPGSDKALPEACAIISEDSPPLTSVISIEDEEEAGSRDELEKQRISWDTAL